MGFKWARLPGWFYGPLVLVLAKADLGERALGLSLLSVLASGSVPELSLERGVEGNCVPPLAM